jgi:hypothetical protein
LASLRHRPSQAKVRSTIQRVPIGKTGLLDRLLDLDPRRID